MKSSFIEKEMKRKKIKKLLGHLAMAIIHNITPATLSLDLPHLLHLELSITHHFPRQTQNNSFKNIIKFQLLYSNYC